MAEQRMRVQFHWIEAKFVSNWFFEALKFCTLRILWGCGENDLVETSTTNIVPKLKSYKSLKKLETNQPDSCQLRACSYVNLVYRAKKCFEHNSRAKQTAKQMNPYV